jgi:hypothetical protein
VRQFEFQLLTLDQTWTEHSRGDLIGLEQKSRMQRLLWAIMSDHDDFVMSMTDAMGQKQASTQVRCWLKFAKCNRTPLGVGLAELQG